MNAQPNDDEILIAAELASGPPPAKVIPIDQDRWWVMRLDGNRFGPFSWKELTRCVTAHMFGPDDLVQGEQNPRRRLRELFPKFFAVAPPPSIEIRPIASPMEQLASNPVGVMLRGYEMRPYERTDPQGKNTRRNLVILAILASVWGVGMIGLMITAAVGGGMFVQHAVFGIVVTSFFYGLGYLTFAGALFEWEILFTTRRAKSWRYWFGDRAARKIFLGMGALFMLAGCGAFGMSCYEMLKLTTHP
ncbi:immunity 17 family protein [Anatilimnocola floriformis]|uniref:immunity 17 family protein n=1 Tax=Anatilimnocola floriformis TaxID=2948575 RepID=UPI0020C4A799|nr:immunity 17 family protein [Anatilimnocola floriformis]